MSRAARKTSRKKPGARKSSDVTHLALEAGQVGTWHWDVASNRIVWSQNMEQIHAMDPGSFDGTFESFQSTIHAEDRARVLAAIREAVEQGDDYYVEYRNATSEDTIQWLEARGRVRRAPGGRPLEMAGVCMDVTQRKRAARRLAAQYAVTRLLTESDELAEAGPDVLRIICEAVDWDLGELWRWDAESHLLRSVGRWHHPALAAGEASSAAALRPGEGLAGRVFSGGDAEWVADVAADAELRGRLVAAAELRTGFAFPIGSGRRRTGVIALFSRIAVQPDRELLEMLEALGQQIGIIAERREVETSLRKRAEQQTVVSQLGQLALSRSPLAKLLDEVVTRVADTLGVEYAKVLEHLPDGQFLLRAGVGWKPGYVGHETVPADQAQAGYALESSEPVIVIDLAEETRFPRPRLLREHDVVSGLSAVIYGRPQPFGVLGAHTRKKRTFTVDDANFLQAVANVLAMAIESGRAEETIRRLSTPVLPLHDHMLILPVVGTIDEPRARQLADQLLSSIRTHRAKVVVIDATGVPSLEPEIVRRLMDTSQAARLLGAKIILTGISNDVGKALVEVGVDLSDVTSLTDLRSGVEEAERILGYHAAWEPLPQPPSPRGGSRADDRSPRTLTGHASASPEERAPLPKKE